MAYGQFSRLANEWLDIDNARQIDNQLMGGKIYKEKYSFDFDLLNQAIWQIAEADEKRAKEVTAFYQDYHKSIENVSKTVKKGGYACYVVGNRKVKSITLPTDEITKFLFESQGFEHIETVVRNIPNKRMPLKNSPTNITGKTDTTMNNSPYAVILSVRICITLKNIRIFRYIRSFDAGSREHIGVLYAGCDKLQKSRSLKITA